ncbi:TonB-dependent receptor plug domain-containing protein [Actomonas aquatica]|uniref:TonB-dependent receptor n=1 Tax=Actomonas aquatica TaxID=2866162 RepID=A0ABZ1CFV9_9BACT|nr:TonB-dependent receptor [Opitutus sp. WL0086]WRQ89454.1 TonB-dependent receptor [Opitutus sp. WL0086]
MSDYRTTRWGRLVLVLTAATVAALPVARAQFTDFTTMDLADLSYVRITSLGRTEHTLVDYPAAATVLVSEDIDRLGVLTLADTLRGVPGLQVARIDPFHFAVSARGFNDNTVNKMLVVADGRSLHDGTFSGTNWGMQDMLLGDLDRIEVLRGPGASLWGANAMNGFINIVSKPVRETFGTHAALAVGEDQLGMAEVRHGWSLSNRTAARVYAKVQHQEADASTLPFIGIHEWQTALAGTRVEHSVTDDRQLTVIAEWRELDANGESFLPTLVPPYRDSLPEDRHARAGNISLEWQQPLPLWNGGLKFNAGFDHLRDRRDTLSEERNTVTADLQAKLYPLPGHELLTGLTYRRTLDHLSSNTIFSFSDPSDTVTFFGAFVQDEFDPIPDRLRLTVGAKLEQNSYSGWEFQPSLRAIWALHPEHRLWAAISKAARTPSRAEHGVDYFSSVVPANPPYIPLPVATHIRGSEDFSSEYLTAFEVGYRYAPHPRLTLEATYYYNDYTDLRGFYTGTVTPVFAAPVPHFAVDVPTSNDVVGHTKGGEINLTWQAAPSLRFETSYSWMHMNLTDQTNVGDEISGFSVELYELSTPSHTTRAQASWSPHPDWDLDLGWQQVGSLESGLVPTYDALHVRLAWTPHPAWRIELIGRDLLDAQHREYAEIFSREVQPNLSRSLYLRLTFQR